MNNMESASNMSISMLNMRGPAASSSCSSGGVAGSSQQHQRLDLPPGFRFHPTDEELVVHYLKNKVSSCPLPVPIIAEIDLYKFDPWDLPGKAICGESEWYFFTPRDRKYPNGARPNRAAGSGYWKATGTDKPITTSVLVTNNVNMQQVQHVKLGVKKALVFYKGRPPKGVKTNWIMHEYRLAPDPSSSKPPSFSTRRSLRLDDWVLCRIYRKSSQASRAAHPCTAGSNSSSCVDEVFATLQADDDHHAVDAVHMQPLDEVDADSVHIYNVHATAARQLPRYHGSLGRLIMGAHHSAVAMPDPFLDGLVAADHVSTSHHLINLLHHPHPQLPQAIHPPHPHLSSDHQSTAWAHLTHLDTNLSAAAAATTGAASTNPNSLFTRTDPDAPHKRNTLSPPTALATASDNNMGLNIGLSTIFPPIHPPQLNHQQQQQEAPCDDANTSGGDAGDESNTQRWPFEDARPKFPFG